MKINFFTTIRKSQSLDALTAMNTIQNEKVSLPAKTVRVANTQERYKQGSQKEPKKVTWGKQLATVLTTPSVKLIESKLSSSIPTPPPMPEATNSHQAEGGKSGMDKVIAQLQESPVFKKNAEKYQAASSEPTASLNTPPPPPPMAKFKGITVQPNTDGKSGMDKVIAQLQESPVFKKNAEKYQAVSSESMAPLNTPPPPPPMAKFKGITVQPNTDGKSGMDKVIAQLQESPVFLKRAEKYQAASSESTVSLNTPPPPPPMAKFEAITKRNTAQPNIDTKAGMDKVIAELKEHPIFKLKESN